MIRTLFAAWLVVAGCVPNNVVQVPVRGREAAAVSIIDATGWFQGARVPANPARVDGPGSTFVVNPDGRLNALRLQWISGRCLVGATIQIVQGEPLTVIVTSDSIRNVGGCNEDRGIRYVVDLEFDRAVPADQVIAQDLTHASDPTE